MNEIVTEIIKNCDWGETRFFIFSENVFNPLIYYSHIVPLITSLILGIFILLKSKKNLASKIIFTTIILLDLWLLGDSILWATNKPHITMFFWSLINIIEPIIYAGILYFFYVYIDGKDINFQKKSIIFLLIFPTIVLTPTSLGFSGYDLTTCDRDAIEGPMVYYGYLIEIIFIIWLLAVSIKRIIKNKEREDRERIIFLTLGSSGFLIAFSFGNIIGSLFDTYSIGGDYSWAISQYGLFGIPIFMGFLSYLIVRYKAFEIKILGSQILIFTIIILIGATLLVNDVFYSQIIILITLILIIGLGYYLVKNIRREVEQREKIEKLAKDLFEANNKLKELDQMKSEFLSLATHQLRAPLTAIKGYSSMLIEGDYGVLPPKAKESTNVILKSCQNLINIVNDFLNISRIEQGRMVYEKSIFDFGELVKEVADEHKVNIVKTGLSFSLEIPKSGNFKINADRDKMRQVISNILDNSLKYTLRGSIVMSVIEETNKILVKIKDTGIGIEPNEINKLFSKFSRAKTANKTNVIGTGLGLYIAKKMTEDQGGNIKVFSEGQSKGSTFTIEMPKV